MTTPSVPELLRELFKEMSKSDSTSVEEVEMRLFAVFEEAIRSAPIVFSSLKLVEELQVQLSAVVLGWSEIFSLLDKSQMKLQELVVNADSRLDAILSSIVYENYRDELLFAQRHGDSSLIRSNLEAFEKRWRPLFLPDVEAEKHENSVLLHEYGKRLLMFRQLTMRAPVTTVTPVFRGYAQKLDTIADRLQTQTQSKLDRPTYAPILTALHFSSHRVFAQRAQYLRSMKKAS